MNKDRIDTFPFKKLHLDFSISTNDATFWLGGHDPRAINVKYDKPPVVHTHPFFEFHYIYKGDMTAVLPSTSESYTLHTGDFLLIPPDVLHLLRGDIAERISIAFYVEPLQIKTDSYRAINKLLNSITHCHILNDRYITDQMNLYLTFTKNNTFCVYTQGAAILMSAITYMLNYINNTVGVHAHIPYRPLNVQNKKTAIRNFIAGRFDTGTLAEIADQFALSERHTGEIIRNIMGKSFKELMLEEKMRVADMYIEKGNHTLEEISEIVGYSSYSGFYTAYKKYHGHGPRLSKKR